MTRGSAGEGEGGRRAARVIMLLSFSSAGAGAGAGAFLRGFVGSFLALYFGTIYIPQPSSHSPASTSHTCSATTTSAKPGAKRRLTGNSLTSHR